MSRSSLSDRREPLRPTTKAAPAPLSGLRPLDNGTLARRVYEQLRHFLMVGGAQPGEKLTLRQLTGVFGTSLMPVREAVQRLAAEGALVVLPNRTIRVPIMTQSRFRETRRIRIALEGMAVEEATARITADDLAQLQALNTAFTEEMRRKRNDADRMFRANKEFHFTIYRAANMPVLLGLIENMWLQIGPMLHFSLGFRGREMTSRFAPDCHDNLVKALQRRDAKSARTALETDIMNAGELILRVGNLPE